MNIIFLSRLFYPHVGGVEKHVFEVGKRLVGQGHTVTVITELLPGVVQREKVEGISVYRIPVGNSEKGKKFAIWRWLWEHRELLQDADIVHAHDVFFWYLPFRFFYPRKRSYITFHGYEGYPVSSKAKLMRTVAEKLTHGNICVGEFIKKWYGTHPTFVTYGAVTTPVHVTHVSSPSAGFIGRLDPITGVQRYAESIDIIKRSYPEFRFVIAGEGPLKKELEKTYDIVASDQGEQFLQEFQFAFVSGYLTILEALAAKRLVFAFFDNPIKFDYLQMTPYAKYIIITDSVTELAEKVVYYLTHADKADELKKNGYKWAKEQTWEKLTEVYTTLWNKK